METQISLAKTQIEPHIHHYAAMDNDMPLSFASALKLWQHNVEFRDLITSQLVNSPFRAFRWETPPLITATLNRPFEFVLVDSPDLTDNPNRTAFQPHFTKEAVVAFENLGKDAMMIVPCPQAAPETYVHLAAFVHNAPASQIHALWKAVGGAVEQRVSDRPLWLSTAGGGVAWLHVRLDSRPKYYSYTPYKSM